MTTFREQIEAVAVTRGVKLDGISDDLTAARLVLARVPGTDPNRSPTYVEAAIEALARSDGANGETARTAEEHRAAASFHATEAARLEEDGYMTAADVHAAAAQAHKEAASAQGEEGNPVASRAARNASAKAAILGVAHPKGTRATAAGRADAERVVRIDGEPSAAAARQAMIREFESAYRSPLAARIDDGAEPRDGPHIDGRTMSIEQLEAATAAARKKAREDSEKEWQRPLRSSQAVVDGGMV